MTSFNLTWNTEKNVGSKVFARKRKQTIKKSESKQTIKTSEPNHTSSQVEANEPIAVRKTKPLRKFPKDDNNIIKTTQLVKRKRKKDKLLAKLDNNRQTNATENSKSKDHSLFSATNKFVSVKSNPHGKSVVEKLFSGGKLFSDLSIHKYIVSNLAKIGFTTLTNVQEKSIPVILSGKNVLIRSQTGSGKTLAYAVPILNALQSLNPRLQRSDGVQAIIVVPTRELALQTHEIFGKINTFQWIVMGHLCGGENRNTEKTRLRKGVHILIATPGRLLDHLLHTSCFKTNKVRCLVLDEADRLLDMGFKKDIVCIVEEINKAKSASGYDPLEMVRKKKKQFDTEEPIFDQDVEISKDLESMPLADINDSRRQILLLSATLSKGITELTDFIMEDHTYVDTLEESANLNPQFLVIPSTVKQQFIVTHVKHRLFTLSALLLTLTKKTSKTFVFMGTSTMVDYHYELFTRFLIKMPKSRGNLKSGDVVLLEGVEDSSDDEEETVMDVEFFKLHGSMEQSARKEVFGRFRAAKRGILLCTDVVARGIDVPAADCIIQYNGPQTIENYLHRVGRTGRAGKMGTSIIFLTPEEQDFISKMESHKVFLQKLEADDILKNLCTVMQVQEQEKAALALQRYYEQSIVRDRQLHRLACLAYSSWSRFYNTYPGDMRKIFDFKKANLGYYVTSFGLKETPTEVSKIIRNKLEKKEKPRLNSKLANYEDERSKKPPPKRKIKSLSLSTSEFSSGLEPSKKKKKKVHNK